MTYLRLVFIIIVFFSLMVSAACRESQADHGISPAMSSLPESNKEINIEEQSSRELDYLKKLRQKTKQLESFKCSIEYLSRQPLLESQTLRKGEMYYRRFEEKSKLRINFSTLQQDDYKEQKYREEYIFDGVWLTHLDYQIESARLIQQAEPNEPVDAFELAKRNFPMIGFSRIEDITREFEVGPAEEVKKGDKNYIKFHFNVKPDSRYKDEYKTVDLWIDKKLELPSRISAVTIEEDIYEIFLKDAQVNVVIDPRLFDVKIPKHFGQPEVIPFEKSKAP